MGNWERPLEGLYPAGLEVIGMATAKKATYTRNASQAKPANARNAKGNGNLIVKIWSSGDYSVGISGNQATLDFGLPAEDVFADKEHRNFIRDKLKEIFGDLFDTGGLHVDFSDECCECGALLDAKGACPTEYCPSKRP